MESQKLIVAAMAMPVDRAEMALRDLAMDERFPAIIKLIQDQRASFIEEASKPIAAHHTGCIQHAMGAVHALGQLIDDLAAQIPDPKRRRPKEAPEES